MNRPHSRTLRTGRYSEPGHIYLITTLVTDRQPIFRDFTIARICIQILRQQDENNSTATLAFMLMPDHLHWLVTLQSGTLERLLHRFKGASARRINQHRGMNGKVWQAGYHDHALRQDEDIRTIARYVVANPLRAGLVSRIWDYPHWDARWVE